MIRIFLCSFLALLILAPTLEAQSQQQNRRGRLFRKLKNELFGSNSEDSSDKKEPTLAPSKPPRSATTIPAKPTSGKRSTSVNHKHSVLQSSNHFQKPNPQSTKRPYTANNYNSKKNISSIPTNYRPKRKSNHNGFGFQVALNEKDRIIVSKVNSEGNAISAGIRRGDEIKEIGGIEATSIEEFNEIAKIMTDGDQMEFLIRRGSRDKKIDVQFGQVSEPTDREIASVESQSQNKRYDFAPPSEPHIGENRERRPRSYSAS
ncbi:MAG: PDZ domain-containing protein, partial [Planctomycetota bacterium]